MARFLDLPREIRDMCYVALITAERPRPTLGEAQWLFDFRRVFEPASIGRGEYGCCYSSAPVPDTCANFLRCNRQVYEEMRQALRVAKRKQMLCAKLDCIAEDESFHYFTWLGIPVVRTTKAAVQGRSRIMPSWADGILERYLYSTNHELSSGVLDARSSSTLIHQLWVDVRLFGDRSRKWFHNTSPPDRTSWAICAALKQLFEKGPDLSSPRISKHVMMVDELVLNVVTQPNVPKDKYLAEDEALDTVRDGLVHPKTVARELVDVWNKIWAGEDYKGRLYQVLLERIKTVRVCINDETWRTRELRLELERGQAERRRIAARVGW